jgi:NAD(P)-dependent dehydrogenase (short-subunit alcohol dehydrogenase family)
MPEHSTGLAGKVAVVIGGTTGLGLSAAHAFLMAGARGLIAAGRGSASADGATASPGGSRFTTVEAALAAARSGCQDVLLIERYGFPGGTSSPMPD